MYEFFVPGIPKPGGSKKAFRHAKTGKIIVTDSCKGNKDWRAVVALAATEAFREGPLTGPLQVEFGFCLLRPKGHFGTGKRAAEIRSSAPTYPTVKPDTTKLIRSTEDAMTGIVWRDDSQIVIQHGTKVYSDRAGCLVTVRELDAVLRAAKES